MNLRTVNVFNSRRFSDLAYDPHQPYAFNFFHYPFYKNLTALLNTIFLQLGYLKRHNHSILRSFTF